MNALVFNVLEGIGINPERFSLQWASAAEAPRFVKLITDFTGRIKKLGPMGQAEGIEPEEVKARLAKALAAVSSRKVRMVYGNTAKSIRKEAIFTQEYISGVIAEKLTNSITGALTAEEEPAEQAPSAETKDKAAAAPKTAAKEAPAKSAPAEEKPAKEKTAAKKKSAAEKKKTTAKKK